MSYHVTSPTSPTFPPHLMHQAAGIGVLICDVDGILTDGSLLFSHDGQPLKAFFSQDGIGFKALLKQGIHIAIISGHHADCVTVRMHELGVHTLFQGVKDKCGPYQKIKEKWGVSDENIAYIGDDLPDLPLIKCAGLGVSVPNGIDCVQQAADWITPRPGGKGAVRDLCDLLLLARQC